MHDHSSPRTHLRRYLAGGYGLFIAYASLAPFTGWQEQGLGLLEVMTAPLGQTFTWFDFIFNLLAYLPFGFLLLVLMRAHAGTRLGFALALLLGCGMSLLMEYAQLYLPTRVSSNSDLISNSIGVFFGALFALRVETASWFVRLHRWYGSWFRRGNASDFGLALLGLWLFVQVNPSLPMLGSMFISQVAPEPFAALAPQPFDWKEVVAVALNLLLPTVLLLTLLRQKRHAINLLLFLLLLITLAKFMIAAVLLKSWALLLWLNGEALLGVLLGFLLAALATRLGRNWLLLAALPAVLGYMVLIYQTLESSEPAGSLRLYHWHYGHMMHYNSLSKAVSMLFPLLLVVHLVWVWLLQRKERR